MTTVGTKCTQPGCDGVIEGGYCNVCGLAEPSAPVASGAAAGGASSGGSRTSGRTSSSTSGGSAPTRSRPTPPSSSRASRGSLGAGLIEIPPVPARDPATAVLANPQVPESKRFCGACERPVGRGKDGRPGLTDGYCPNCGTQFSFTPKLVPGEMVA